MPCTKQSASMKSARMRGPILGRMPYRHPVEKVLGGILIGDNVTVGANSVIPSTRKRKLNQTVIEMLFRRVREHRQYGSHNDRDDPS